MRARLRTKAYDNGLLEDSFKTSVLAHIKKNQLDGVDLCQFYTIAHGLRRKEQRAAMVALTWLPEGSHQKSQIMVQ